MPSRQREVPVSVPVEEGLEVNADLAVPPDAHGLVVFAHGSGSSRHSARNRFVAERLQSAGLGTLLLDLLTPEEERLDAITAELRFDIPLLAERLVGAVSWLKDLPQTAPLGVGLFGASTGAAAALVAAARLPRHVRAVVSRGGRPDLAGDLLPCVRCPTLLLVGQRDPEALALNEEAALRLKAPQAIEVVPDATHLFPEPGALEHVAERSAAWFARYLPDEPAAQEGPRPAPG
jgi:putative phosphoribosyl transferase